MLKSLVFSISTVFLADAFFFSPHQGKYEPKDTISGKEIVHQVGSVLTDIQGTFVVAIGL